MLFRVGIALFKLYHQGLMEQSDESETMQYLMRMGSDMYDCDLLINVRCVVYVVRDVRNGCVID